MNLVFEEIAWHRTRLGELVLRRRTEPSLGVEVYEIKLGDEFLMSSLFTEGEVALARHALAGLGAGPLDVAVAGLGLGYTARAVLEHLSVRSLLVIEALGDVVAWHRGGLAPLGAELTSDPRCELLEADFFALANGPGLNPREPHRRFHAIVADVDHSPRHLLHSSHGVLYAAEGLRRLASHLHPEGVFALWSNDPPDADFGASLDTAFVSSEARVVRFANPLTGGEAANTVYVARTPRPQA
jgi:spermidine synthase